VFEYFFFLYIPNHHARIISFFFFTTHLAFMIERIFGFRSVPCGMVGGRQFTGQSRNLGLSISFVEQGNDGFIFISMVMPLPQDR
jgi:hypothetical protein